MKKVAMWIAWIGLALSLVVHVVSFFGVSLFERFAFLHLGIFLIGVPIVFTVKNRTVMRGSKGPRETLQRSFEGGPIWGPKAVIYGFWYLVLNFGVLATLSHAGVLRVQEGRYLLMRGGSLIAELSQSEYQWQLSHRARLFSAAWALGYLSLALWYRSPKTPGTLLAGQPPA
jgi:hypothetical protein